MIELKAIIKMFQTDIAVKNNAISKLAATNKVLENNLKLTTIWTIWNNIRIVII